MNGRATLKPVSLRRLLKSGPSLMALNIDAVPTEKKVDRAPYIPSGDRSG